MLGILKSGMPIQNIIIEIFAMLGAMVIAFTMHEWAHGFVAYKNGDMTAKFMGRLTLNPIKHIDPMGFAMLLLAGFGWAKPVPIDSNNFKHYRKGIITVSLAGVVMNLILAIVFAGLLGGVYAILNATNADLSNQFLYLLVLLVLRFLLYGIVINLTLMAFNILPIFPLDGFHIVETFTKYGNKYCAFMRKYGNFILLGLILVSTILGTFVWFLDIFGMYIGAVRNGVMWVLGKLFHIPII